MSAYIVAQLKFRNPDAYRRYQNAFPSVFAKFDGEVLVADEAPRILEGKWSGDKIVILAFADEAEARRFQDDPEYQAIATDRKAGAEAIVILASGVKRRSG
jgi:uncharacterized protein (DUF1330 family)